MHQKKYFTTGLMIVFLIALFLPSGVCLGQEQGESNIALESETAGEVDLELEEDASGEAQVEKGMTMLQLVKKGGIVGSLIILLSFIALGLVIDYAVTIRRSKLAPQRDIAVLKKLIHDKKFEELKKLDQERTSFLSRVVIAGLNEVDFGYQAMIKAMEDASEAFSARIARKIEHLNVIGNISPMMGLLGTVIGMLRCFNEISQVTGAIEPKQLAGGIFEALVTTCMGLIVAIPALYFYALFRNRVDEFTGTASLAAEELVASFKTDNERK
jgi:biopolymer transport protein ExbB